jgi:hypothetical protein
MTEDTNGNGKVARAEVEGLEKRFEDCRMACLDWRHDMDGRVRNLERGHWIVAGILAVIQFVGFGIMAHYLNRIVR